MIEDLGENQTVPGEETTDFSKLYAEVQAGDPDAALDDPLATVDPEQDPNAPETAQNPELAALARKEIDYLKVVDLLQQKALQAALDGGIIEDYPKLNDLLAGARKEGLVTMPTGNDKISAETQADKKEAVDKLLADIDVVMGQHSVVANRIAEIKSREGYDLAA